LIEQHNTLQPTNTRVGHAPLATVNVSATILAKGTDIPHGMLDNTHLHEYHGLYITTNTVLNASVKALFGYELIAVGSWNCGAPSYSISSGKTVGK